MIPEEPEPFRTLTPTGRRVFVVSVAVAIAAFFVLHSLGVDPPPQPVGTGRQPLYSLGISVGLGVIVFIVGRWFFIQRGIGATEDHDEKT